MNSAVRNGKHSFLRMLAHDLWAGVPSPSQADSTVAKKRSRAGTRCSN
jgi:hypothetical protein